jgi:hypothetical protein
MNDIIKGNEMEGHLEGGKCLAVVSDHEHLSLFVICTSHSRVKIEISFSALYWPIIGNANFLQ